MRPQKYRNVRTTVDGHSFASKKEANRWCELVLLQQAGQISGLGRQPRYKLHAPNGDLIGCYVADFAYEENGRLVVEDVKSVATAANALYRWKAKHFTAEYGIRITEV
jgi:hypothetical protein